jgi:hypothetical protein
MMSTSLRLLLFSLLSFFFFSPDALCFLADFARGDLLLVPPLSDLADLLRVRGRFASSGSS